jgi:hypothetical protein
VQLWRQGTVRAVERVECPLEADSLVLDHLTKLGCDPASPRECRHYLYVRGELAARAVAHALVRHGWAAELEDVGGSWLVTASVLTALDHDIVRDTRTRLEGLAADFGGHYDGWEAAAD